MIYAIAAVFVAGFMLLSGGTALALQHPQGRRAGIVMSICGAVLVLLVVLGILWLASGTLLPMF